MRNTANLGREDLSLDGGAGDRAMRNLWTSDSRVVDFAKQSVRVVLWYERRGYFNLRNKEA